MKARFTLIATILPATFALISPISANARQIHLGNGGAHIGVDSANESADIISRDSKASSPRAAFTTAAALAPA